MEALLYIQIWELYYTFRDYTFRYGCFIKHSDMGALLNIQIWELYYTFRYGS